VFFKEGHASGLRGPVGKEAAESRAEGREEDEEDEVGVIGSVEDDEEIGDARNGQRNEGAVDGRDEDEPGEAEVIKDVHQPVTGGGEEQSRDR
jgi:hypothetical protein